MPRESSADLIPSPDEPLPEGEAKAKAVRAMFDTIAPNYDRVNRIMTFRMDVGWRRKTVDALALAPGRVVLDIASGTGDLCYELDRRGITPIGVDMSFNMLAAAPRPFRRVHGDALRLPIRDGSVDGATCGFALRNFVDLGAMFAELGRTIRPGGRIALVDVGKPPNPVMAFGHRVYFGRVVPAIGGLFSDRNAYRYLPRSVAYLPEPAEIIERLRQHGFGDATRRELSGGIAQLFTATRD